MVIFKLNGQCLICDLMGNLERIRSCGCCWDNSHEGGFHRPHFNEAIVNMVLSQSPHICLQIFYIEMFSPVDEL